VVSISTTRETPKALGLLHEVGMAPGIGAAGATGAAIALSAALSATVTTDPDPPPLKWSDLRYVFDIKEDCNVKEAIQA
jgi:hypothetical protein